MGWFFFSDIPSKIILKKYIEVWDPSPEEIISNEVKQLNKSSVCKIPT